MTRLSSDIDMVRGFVSHSLSLMLRALLMVVGSVVMMFIIDLRLAMITLILLPLAGFLIAGLMWLARPMFATVQEKLSALNTTVQENLAGVQVVQAYVRERFEIGRFKVNNEDYMAEIVYEMKQIEVVGRTFGENCYWKFLGHVKAQVMAKYFREKHNIK